MVRAQVSAFGWLVAAAAVIIALSACANRAALIYRRAEMFFGRGEYELAVAEYRRVAETYPDDILADDALYKLGYLYRVHLQQPRQAIAAYTSLAGRYPRSPYADEALLWCVHIWARTFHSATRAAETCRLLDERFPNQRRQRARAHLEVARARLAAGDAAAARKEARFIAEEFPDQREVAAAAALIEARALEAEGAPAEKVSQALEAVATGYEGTRAAAEARRRLGLAYYARRKEEEKQRQAEMKRQTRWLGNLVPFREWADPRLTMLDALRTLLSHSGRQLDLPTLAAASGQGLVPIVDPQLKSWPVLWQRDPLIPLAEAAGAVPSVWVAASKQDAWEAARGAIIRSQPCLVAYGGRRPWVILGGWKPQQQTVGLLRPGAAELVGLSLDRFLAGWRPAHRAAPYIAFPQDSYYVFTISGTREAAGPHTLLTRAVEAVARLPVAAQELGLPSPRDVARSAAVQLLEAASPSLPSRWIDVTLPRWAEVRRVLADFLEPTWPELASAARHIADVVGSLREALRSAQSSEAPERDWRAAASYADRLAAEEDNFAAALAAVAAE